MVLTQGAAMADPTTDEPSTDAPDNTDTPTETPDLAAMAEALKKANAEAKKYRLEAKANAEKAEELARQSMTDQEKALETARAEARSEALRDVGVRLVTAEFKAAAAGRNVDVKALLEGIDAARFLDDDGDPDTERIQKWVDRLAPEPETSLPRVPAGVRDTTTPKGGPAQDFAKFISRRLQES